MRELKFRQPIYVDGVFSKWHYWGYLEDGFVGPHSGNREHYQFTGRRDIAGLEVYENYICISDHAVENGTVEYLYSSFCLKTELGYTILSTVKGLKIIGNIHENTELMGEL